MSVLSRIADYPLRHITRLLKLLLWRGFLLSCQKSLRLLRRHWLPLNVCSRCLPALVGVLTCPTSHFSVVVSSNSRDWSPRLYVITRQYTSRRPYHWYHELQI